MAYSVVQTAMNNANLITSSYTIDVNDTTAGNLLVLILARTGITYTPVITDSQSGTWTRIGDSGNLAFMFYRPNITGGDVTITLTVSNGSVVTSCCIVREYSNVLTSSPLDTSVSQVDESSTTTHPRGTTSTPAVRRNLVVMTDAGAYSTLPTYSVSDGDFVNCSQHSYSGFSKVVCAISDKEINDKTAQSGEFTTTYSLQTRGFVAVFKNAFQPKPDGFMAFF